MLLLLAGCGGGGGGGGDGGPGIDPRLARLDIYEAQRVRVLGDPGAGAVGLPVSTFENLPQMGVFDFDGSATIRVEDGARPLVLYGDAAITVNFDLGAAEGDLSNFFGNTTAGVVVDYAGEIGLVSGNAEQDLIFEYEGDLTGSGEVLAFDGQLQGTFLGASAGALVAADLEAIVTYRGQPQSATLVVITETAGSP